MLIICLMRVPMKKKFCLLLLSLVSTMSTAQTIWQADAPGNWGAAVNWSAGVPTAATSAVFDGTHNGNCIINAGDVAASLNISATYTGAIDLNGNMLSIVGPGNNTFFGGSFTGTGSLIITSTDGANFNGTDFGANAEVTLTLTTANGIFTGGPGSIFGGKVTVTAHSILLNGSTYNSTTILTKSSAAAASSSIGDGGNTFNGTTTISNEMNAVFRTANSTGDIFNSQVTFSLDGTSENCRLEIAYGAGTSTMFNGNIKVRTDNNFKLASVLAGNIANNAYISFGRPTGGGSSILASGFTIQEAAGADVYDANRLTEGEFLYGDLAIYSFTQSGGTAQSINLRIPTTDASVTALRLLIGNGSTFNGNVTFSASNPYISNTTFNGNVNTLTKTTGSGTDAFAGGAPSFLYTWDGGNTFNNTTTIDNRGQCTMVLGGTSGDTFNGNVTFNANQTQSSFMIAQVGTTHFKGNISLTQPGGAGPSIQFGFSGGTVLIDGTSAQALNSQTSVPRFANLTMNNSAGLTLNIPAIVNSSLNMTSGVITSSSTNYLSLTSGASVSNASDASFVDGPVRKTGKAAFVFPIGDAGNYHPLGMSAPSTITSEFSAQYLLADHGLGAIADGGLVKVSDCEYWTFTRITGTDNVSVTPYWNGPSSFCHANYITVPGDLQVARWSGTLWNNLGQTNLQTGAQPDGTDGNLTTSAALPDAATHTITFGSLSELNVLPIVISSFDVTPYHRTARVSWQTSSENNNAFFSVERLEGNQFATLANIPGSGTTSQVSNYEWIDLHPKSGLSYYRLKQTDFDGRHSFSPVVALMIDITETPYPNPVKDVLHLNFLNAEDEARLVITDVTGQIVYDDIATESIDIGDFKPGIYHLRLTSKKNVEWYSIMKE
jgi:hypothetical protein